ncbi:MAG TPA: hypothetical protein VGL34_24675 [Steroidobacteraceae bacterium]
MSATDTPVVPDTTPEMVYPVLVLVTEPEPLLVCVGALLVNETELPPHAAREMQASRTSGANKLFGRHMNVP